MLDIYRIEWPETGAGPYNWGNAPSYPIELDGSCGRPMPQEDGIWADRNYFYGFASLQQYSGWFGKRSQMRMELEGWILSHYLCRPRYVQRGETQVAFVRKKARYVQALSPLLSPGPITFPVSFPSHLEEDSRHATIY
jgi:hypothetical protein